MLWRMMGPDDLEAQGTYTVKDGNAMVDDIQLGRVYTMFEKDEVFSTLLSESRAALV